MLFEWSDTMNLVPNYLSLRSSASGEDSTSNHDGPVSSQSHSPASYCAVKGDIQSRDLFRSKGGISTRLVVSFCTLSSSKTHFIPSERISPTMSMTRCLLGSSSGLLAVFILSLSIFLLSRRFRAILLQSGLLASSGDLGISSTS